MISPPTTTTAQDHAGSQAGASATTATRARTGTKARLSRRAAAVTAALLATTAGLVGCAPEQPLEGMSYQINSVFIPGYPGQVPDELLGTLTIAFGRSTVVGSTGCAPFRGAVDYLDDKDQPVDPLTAGKVRIHDVKFRDPDEECQGRARFLHDELVKLLPHEFTLTRKPPQLFLTQIGGGVDSPGLELVP